MGLDLCLGGPLLRKAGTDGRASVSGHATIPTNGHETVPTSGHENSPPLAISKACSEAAAEECGCDQAAQSDCGKEQAKGGSGSRTHRGATTFASARTQRIGHQPPASPRPQDRAQVPAAAGSGGPGSRPRKWWNSGSFRFEVGQSAAMSANAAVSPDCCLSCWSSNA